MNDQERLLTIFLRLQLGTSLKKSNWLRNLRLVKRRYREIFRYSVIFYLVTPVIVEIYFITGKTNKYCLASKSVFNKKDILVISKILLENRALNRPEIASLLHNLLVLVPRDDRKEIEQIIGSEKLNYAPLTDQQNRIEKIWNLFRSYFA